MTFQRNDTPEPLATGAMSRWLPDTDAHQARRIGKTAEEVCELGSVLARISIQGLNAIDPASGKSNRQRLLEETADVLAQTRCNMIALFTVDEWTRIEQRVEAKVRQMAEWEAHFGADDAPPTTATKPQPAA